MVAPKRKAHLSSRNHIAVEPPLPPPLLTPTSPPAQLTQSPPWTSSPLMPVPESPSSSSSSDSSDSDFISHHAYIQSNMSCPTASVEHPLTKHCPVLSPGDPSPQILLILENT